MTFTFYHELYVTSNPEKEEEHQNVAKNLLTELGIEDVPIFIYTTPDDWRDGIYDITGVDQQEVALSTFENDQFAIDFEQELSAEQIEILKDTSNVVAYKYKGQ